MTSANLWHRARRILADPGRIGPSIRRRLSGAAYYLGGGGWAFPPVEIVLYVNSTCNARCIMCDIGQKAEDNMFHRQLIKPGGGQLSVQACRGLFAEVGRFKPAININGLEPLLHRDILDLLTAAKEHGLRVKLVTNGILLPEFAKGLVERGLDTLVVSLDGLQPVHDRIRGEGVFQQAVEGIRMVRRFRRHGQDPRIMINYCLTDLNYGGLLEFTGHMLETVGVESIRISHLNFLSPETAAEHNELFGRFCQAAPAGVGIVDPLRIDIEVLWTQMQLVQGKYPEHKVFFSNKLKTKEDLAIYYRQPQRLVTKSRCLTPWRISTILANGDVVVRNRCLPYASGNIHKSGFLKIWNGERYQSFRRELRRAGLFPVCRRCCGTF